MLTTDHLERLKRKYPQILRNWHHATQDRLIVWAFTFEEEPCKQVTALDIYVYAMQLELEAPISHIHRETREYLTQSDICELAGVSYYYSVYEIERAHIIAGGLFFAVDCIKRNIRVHKDIYNGRYFVVSEPDENGRRYYYIKTMDPDTKQIVDVPVRGKTKHTSYSSAHGIASKLL